MKKDFKTLLMKKICVIGHFGFGENMLNGQTIKTKIVTTELERQLGAEQIIKIDTHGIARNFPKIIIQMLKAFKQCQSIIIFPAQNGIRLFVPLCVWLNKIFHRKIHYVVIGGWLNDFLNGHKMIEKKLACFEGVYVETYSMKKKLDNRGFDNIFIMPNFKNIKILKEEELVYNTEKPYKVCTFSRVMREKGIEEAIEAVKYVNEKYNKIIFELDIFGQIDSEQVAWFDNLKMRFPEYVSYKGLVPFEQSVEVLKSYYALLFPTYYEGEGFAGTLIDAMASGIPTIASDWKYNREIVIPGKTGVLVKAKNQEELNEALENSVSDSWILLKKECIKEAQNYFPEKAIIPLIERI